VFISITRLRIRHWWYLPEFFWRSNKSNAQARRAQGFRKGRILVDRNRAFWTLTGWDGESAMRAYRGSGAHKAVMPKLAGWCDEAAVTHYEGDDLPSWTEAWERIKAGRLTPVNKPSPDQQAKRIPEPRLKPLIEQVLEKSHA
jgi:hypothetical protein